MALDSMDVAAGTAASVVLGVAFQAIEDRAPTVRKAEIYTAGVGGLGYLGGLYLMSRNVRRGGSGHTVGTALAYGSAALLGAQTTRYVDKQIVKLTPALVANTSASQRGRAGGALPGARPAVPGRAIAPAPAARPVVTSRPPADF